MLIKKVKKKKFFLNNTNHQELRVISCFGHSFKPLGPHFSFLGNSLLAATPTFGEVHLTATKRTYFSKTRIITFLGNFRLRCRL